MKSTERVLLRRSANVLRSAASRTPSNPANIAMLSAAAWTMRDTCLRIASALDSMTDEQSGGAAGSAYDIQYAEGIVNRAISAEKKEPTP